MIDREVERRDVTAVYAKINALAVELGTPRALNMIALGAYIKATDVVPLDTVKDAMARMMEAGGKGKFVSMNEKALEEGYNAV